MKRLLPTYLTLQIFLSPKAIWYLKTTLNQEISSLFTDCVPIIRFENNTDISIKAPFFSRIFCDTERFSDSQEIMAQYGMGVL
jgi:hypothetical protein